VSTFKQKGSELVCRVTRTVLGEEAQNTMYRRLAKGAAGTYGQKMANMFLLLLTNLLLARILGLAEFGVYAYAQSWVMLLLIPAVCGMDQLLVRNVAAFQAQAAWNLMSGLLRRANQIALASSLALVMAAGGVSWAMVSYWEIDSSKVVTFVIALCLLPFTVLTRLRQSAMIGLHHIVTGQLPEKIFQPLLFIILISGSLLFWADDLQASTAMGIKVISVLVIFVVGTRMLFKALPPDIFEASPHYQTSSWMRSALPLLLASGLHVVNAQVGILMLGAIAGTKEVGIFVVVNRLAGFILFFLGALNIAVGPTVSRLYAQGDMNQLQHLVTKGARVILFLAAPLAISMMVLGYWFLLAFGQPFTVGQTALAIFSVGQLINVATGPVGTLLIMTGHERDAAISVGGSVILGILLNAILIPIWGLNGAAVAGSFSLALWNILLAIWVYKRLRINPTALGSWWSSEAPKAPRLSSS